MDEIIAKIFSVSIFIYGASHLLQANRWAKTFSVFLKSEETPFIIGALTLPVGLIIVIGHNIWILDFPLFITLCGWGMVIKSCLYLIFPRSIFMITPKTEKNLRYSSRGVGIVMIVVGLILIYDTFWRASSDPIYF